MAKLDEGAAFAGKSIYKMEGSDKLIVRKKGGPSREQMQKSPRLVRSRENAAEFTGVQMAASTIRNSLFYISHLADYNFRPTLISICKKIQLLDTTGDRGQRCIFFSQQPQMLRNFWLNKKYPFPAVVGDTVSCSLNRETKSATIQLPTLIPGISLHLPWKQPLYRFSLSLALVSDVVYEHEEYNDHVQDRNFSHLDTAWHTATETFQTQTLELKLNMTEDLKDSQTLLLAIGIEMGTPGANGEVTGTKRCGSACILALA